MREETLQEETRKISRNWKSSSKLKCPSPKCPTEHTHRDRETQKETERERDREEKTDRDTEKKKDRQTQEREKETERETPHEIPDLGVRGRCQVSHDDLGITLV